MEDVRGYRFGIPVSFAAIAVSFVAVLVLGSRLPWELLLPQCMGQDLGGDGFNLPDVVWSCPFEFRVAVLTCAGACGVLLCTTVGKFLVQRDPPISAFVSVALRWALASISVGILYLLGVYFSELLDGKGVLNRAYMIGIPVILSLLHFPRLWGLVMAIPVAILGSGFLILISALTGIPLD